LVSHFNRIKEKWRTLYKDSYQKERNFKLFSLEDPPTTVAAAATIRSDSDLDTLLRPQQFTKQYSSKQEILKEMVQERNEVISDLKKGALEVRDLFVETAKLVNYQKPIIDTIDTQLDDVQQQTEDGMNTLAKVILLVFCCLFLFFGGFFFPFFLSLSFSLLFFCHLNRLLLLFFGCVFIKINNFFIRQLKIKPSHCQVIFSVY
jgi:hypothetical protein